MLHLAVGGKSKERGKEAKKKGVRSERASKIQCSDANEKALLVGWLLPAGFLAAAGAQQRPGFAPCGGDGTYMYFVERNEGGPGTPDFLNVRLQARIRVVGSLSSNLRRRTNEGRNKARSDGTG